MALKFDRATPIGGDETAGYNVILDKEYSVKEFVKEILTYKKEWGNIYVKGGSSCEYRYGNLLSDLTEDDLGQKVLKVTSMGGWSLMNYYINIK